MLPKNMQICQKICFQNFIKKFDHLYKQVYPSVQSSPNLKKETIKELSPNNNIVESEELIRARNIQARQEFAFRRYAMEKFFTCKEDFLKEEAAF